MEYGSPMGEIRMKTADGFLTELAFSDGEGTGKVPGTPMPEAARWLCRYFAGERPDPADLRILPAGTEFQRRVWALVCRIPYGETRTYGALARQLEEETGRKASARAVGAAVGKNPIAIVIPCHRVVGAGGKLTGYAWGLERKKWLLKFEEETR